MIRILTPSSACESLQEQLRPEMTKDSAARATWFANYMRYACAVYCPIPRGKLVRTTFDLLASIVEATDSLQKEIESTIDGLFESGDLLEISRFCSSDEHYSGDWIFLAPPSFIQRNSGRIYICGVATDDAPILPLSLHGALKAIGPYRFLPSSCGEITHLLKSVGLREIPEAHWLETPKMQSPQQLIEQASHKLSGAPPAGLMEEVHVFLKNDIKHIQYRDRWSSPQSKSGCFICRRPSGYGAENWCYAELNNGIVMRFVDLPWAGEKLRGCDVGWHLQLAIDSCGGHPATYRAKQVGDQVAVRFSFPIPLWAQRRFRAVDEGFNRSPFEFHFSHTEWPTEKAIIENVLWFVSE